MIILKKIDKICNKLYYLPFFSEQTFQEHKSAHKQLVLPDILCCKEAQICIHSEFYHFLQNPHKAHLENLEAFKENDFYVDMALSIGGDANF